MFIAILWILFLSGIVIGRYFRDRRIVRLAGRNTMPTILLLLFLFGIVIGSDRRIMDSLPELGAQAMVMAVACVMGSVFLAGLVYRIVKTRIKD